MDERVMAGKVIKIIPVKTKKQFKSFIDLPDHIYKDEPNWVPKLNMDIKHLLSDKNPFYQHALKKLFLAYDGNQISGRVAAIIDYNYNKFHNEKTGFFGFFECVDNEEIAIKLLKTCEETLMERGMKKIMGPMNPSSNDELGIIIEGFSEPPRLMMPYNHKYYMKLFEKAGYIKAKDLLALNMKVADGPVNRLKKIVKGINKRTPEMRSRPINVKSFKNEIALVREIYNSAWEKNWGFVPWTEEEMTDLAKNLKPLIVSELVQIGFFKDEPIGFLLTLPDYNEIIKKIGRKLFPFGFIKFIMLKKKIKNLRVLALGVKKEYQNKGIGALMYYNALREAINMNYKECEFSWILEDNEETIKMAKMFGGKVYKKYRVYEKNLHNL